MIDYISGKIAELSPTQLVIDNNGIGYTIEISIQTYNSIQGKDSAKIYIHQHVSQKEEVEVFYGFASKDERSLFELIISVNGVGVSSARIMLSSMSSDELREAIISENIVKIKSVKGIGLKSAQRLILELKDKITKGEGSSTTVLFQENMNEIVEEATRALVMLGFAKPNVNKAIQNILKSNPAAKVEEIIKAALKIL